MTKVVEYLESDVAAALALECKSQIQVVVVAPLANVLLK